MAEYDVFCRRGLFDIRDYDDIEEQHNVERDPEYARFYHQTKFHFISQELNESHMGSEYSQNLLEEAISEYMKANDLDIDDPNFKNYLKECCNQVFNQMRLEEKEEECCSCSHDIANKYGKKTIYDIERDRRRKEKEDKKKELEESVGHDGILQEDLDLTPDYRTTHLKTYGGQNPSLEEVHPSARRGEDPDMDELMARREGVGKTREKDTLTNPVQTHIDHDHLHMFKYAKN